MERTKTVLVRVAVFAVSLSLLAGGWIVYRQAEYHASHRQFYTLSEQVAIRLTDFVGARVRIVEALASGMEGGHFTSDQAFRERAAVLCTKFPGFQAINRVNDAGVIDVAYPLPDNEGALGHSIVLSATSGPYYRRVSEELRTVLSGRVDLFTGGSGFTAYVPVVQHGRMTGMVLGVFNMEQLVKTCLSDNLLNRYGISVFDGDHALIDHRPRAVPLENDNPARLSLNLVNRQWNITIFRPRSEGSSWGDGLFLLGVLLVSLGASQLAVRFVREQDRVRLSEEHLRTTLDAIPDAFIVMDRELRILNYQAPRNWRCCSGAQPDAGMTLPDMTGSEFASHVKPLIEKCWKEMAVQADNAVLQDGEDRQSVEVRAVPYEEDTTLLILRNITEQRRVENRLQRAEARYRGIFEASQDAILLTTVTGEILEINQAGLVMFGLDSIADVNLHPIQDFYLNPDDRRKLIDMLRDGRSVHNLEIPLQSLDGRIIHGLISVRLIEAGEDFPEDRLVGTVHDISQLKELQNQLVEAQKMESIGRLAGGIAHDFNNILSSVQGYASLMKSRITPDHPFYEYVDTIERGAVRAGDLTARLLGFARRGQFDRTPLDINRIVEDTSSLLKSTVNKAIEIRTEMSSELAAVKGDRSQLHQVLMNLCVNARDAMQGQEGCMTIVTGMVQENNPCETDFPEVQPGSFVYVRVSDTGVGMDPETIKRIYEPFYSTKKAEGTGLGLAMVYGVVRNHGGFIRIDSNPGKGTTFSVFLPAADEAPVDDSPESRPTEMESVSGETILFVDDEEDNRSLAREILEFNGFTVITAANGVEAVQCYRERNAEINGVVMDLIMPKMGGHEALQVLRAENPDLPIMLVSGFSEDDRIQQVVENEDVLFLRKPFQLNELVRKVAQLVQRS